MGSYPAARRQLHKSIFIHSTRQARSLLAGFAEESFAGCVQQLHLIVSDNLQQQVAEDGISLQDALQILSRTRNLRTLSLTCSSITQCPELVSALSAMHKLEKVSIENDDASQVDMGVVQSRYLPSWPKVTKLSLAGFIRQLPIQEQWSHITTFPAMQLSELTLRSGIILDLDFVDLLSSCSATLESFSISSIKSLSMYAFRTGLASIGGISKLEIRDCSFTDQSTPPPQNNPGFAPLPAHHIHHAPMPVAPPQANPGLAPLAQQRSLYSLFGRPMRQPANNFLAQPQQPLAPGQPAPIPYIPADIVFPENSLARLCPFLCELAISSDLIMNPSSLETLLQLLPLQHLEVDYSTPAFGIGVLVNAVKNLPEGKEGLARLQSLALGSRWIDHENKLERECFKRGISLLWL